VLLSLIGFLRWVFVVPPLADSYVAGDATTRTAVAATWLAQHQYGGALLGEHLGQLLVIAWSVTVSVLILRTGMLPRWAGWLGLLASGLYLANQGDILATAIPGVPVWDLAGLLGSTLWAVWLLALGVVLLRQRDRTPSDPPTARITVGSPRGGQANANRCTELSTTSIRPGGGLAVLAATSDARRRSHGNSTRPS
jgi:hypothetical protein